MKQFLNQYSELIVIALSSTMAGALSGYSILSLVLNLSWIQIIGNSWYFLDVLLKPLVSIATILGIIIALFQFQTANKNRKVDLENARLNYTKEIFNSFVTDIIPLTHAVDSSAKTGLLKRLKQLDVAELDSSYISKVADLEVEAQMDANIDEVFNRLEVQAFLILNQVADTEALVGMFAKPIKLYCVANAEAYQRCKKVRDYYNLDKLISLKDWSEQND